MSNLNTSDDGMVLSLWRGLIPGPPQVGRKLAVSIQISPSVLESVLARVYRETGVWPDEVTGRSRRTSIVCARQYAMWLLRQRKDRYGFSIYSYPQIGRRLGGKDHTTVLHGFRAHQKRLDALEAARVAA